MSYLAAFQPGAFQPDAFQVYPHHASGGSVARRRLKRISEENQVEIPKLKIAVENISLDILPVKYSVTFNDIEIQTQSSTEIQTNSTMYPITTQDIIINTTQDFYDEQEYLKTILILSL